MNDGLGTQDSVSSATITDGAVATVDVADDAITFAKVAKGYEATTITVRADASGDGEATFTFAQAFAAAPAVICTIASDSATAGIVSHDTPDSTAVGINLDSMQPTSATYSVSVIAMEK